VKIKVAYMSLIGKGEEGVNREMITSQLQGKLWLYDEVRT
ncbi:hypothetical protein Tco_0293193, partial [Tanacetum coccineum]